MSGLHVALADALASVKALEALDLGPVDEGAVVLLDGLRDRIAMVAARAAARLAARGEWQASGHSSSPAAWLRALTGQDHAVARRALADGAWLEGQPELREAIACGRITLGHVSAMRPHMTRTPAHEEAFASCLDSVLTVAEHMSPARLAQFAKGWASALDPDQADADARSDYERRQFKLSQTADGWHASGYLPDHMGAEVSAALNAIMDQAFRTSSDDSLEPAPRRRADALHEMARTHLAGLPAASQPRTRTIVTIPAALLAGDVPELEAVSDEAGARRALETFAATWATGNGPGHGPLAPATMRLLTCDTALQRLLLDTESMPLDIGRATRQIPQHLRHALIARDSGCAFPGCERIPAHCEAHHVQHWSKGGTTSLDNLILLCSKHHHVIHHHDNHWHVLKIPGRTPRITHHASDPPPELTTHGCLIAEDEPPERVAELSSKE